MNNKLGLGALTAVVIGSMIGAGVFSLPQNMAAVASPAAVSIGWLITGIGMIFLALAFQYLSENKPTITSGVFGYAQAGFGDFIGFCSAWGYWFSAMLANVSYLVIVFSTLGLLFDTPQHVIFGEGNTWISIIGASILAWLVYALVKRGVETAAIINMITTITKLVPLTLFIVAAMMAFRWNTFTFDFTGLHFGAEHDLLTQIKGTMLVTVWVFIGIEGAVIVSNHAKNRKDVGRATILGLLTALVIYVLVTLLSMGVVSTPELAKMQNPSMAQVLSHILGPWGEVIIGVGLLISVSGAFLSWTLLASEAPYLAAQSGVFPKKFAQKNRKGTPLPALRFTTWAIQISLFAVVFLGGTYNNLLVVASEMILVPYFLVAAYTLKIAIIEKLEAKVWIIGAFASVYGLWLLYASGLYNLLLSALLYLPGVIIYLLAKRERKEKPFNRQDSLILIGLIIAAINACIQLWF